MRTSDLRRAIRDIVADVDVSRWLAGTGETRLREVLAPGDEVSGLMLHHGTFLLAVESIEYGDRRGRTALRTVRLMLMLFAEVRPTPDQQSADLDAALDMAEIVRDALQREADGFTSNVTRLTADGQRDATVMHSLEIVATYYGE